MSGNRRHDLERICQAALDRDPSTRSAFLTKACAGDDALRREVESLLAQEPAADDFMEAPVADVTAERAVAEREAVIGRSIGPYQVVSWLGAGGIGEVYRARDARLDRDVALKVLSGSFAQQPDWLARFRREAKVLASLSHPNIAAIYGVEESNHGQALALELVEGPTLAERLAQGPIPIDEALPMARQIAEALEAAHERGIVHRDLKPANIKLRPDGVVKVLDFGLAKAVEPTGGESPASPSPSPTITMTQAGMILGTPAYMSPEQARGRAVDRRTDVWAFGCVLFEMLTGKRAFGGDDVADTFAAVVGKEPDWTPLPAKTPSAIRRLLRRALTKDIRNRLADASMARLEIEDALTVAESETHRAAVVAVERPRRRGRAVWMLVAASMLALGAISIPAALYLRAPASAEPVVFPVETPPPSSPYDVSISPDGRTIAYTAEERGRSLLYVRPIDSLNARPVAGTEGAWEAFWSPDSRSIGLQVGFGPNSELKTVEVTGGPPRTIARCGVGSWNQDGVVICWDGNTISRVSAKGGALTRVTTLDESLEETGHRFPHFLPDGRHFLYLASSAKPENRAIYVGALDSDRKTRLMTVESRVVYAPPGFLLFHRQGTLFAQAFDATRLALQGEPVRIADGIVWAGNGNGAFAASSTGSLVYRGEMLRGLTWFDRQGRRLNDVRPPGLLGGVALSPDEKRVAYAERGASGGDIWILEISTGISSQLTFDPAEELEPVWSPDSQTVAFASSRMGNSAVFQRALGHQNDVPVFESREGSQWPDDWSSDGRFILINERNAGIVALPTSGDPTQIRRHSGTAVIDEAHFSPDGRWVAYVSTESRQAEIHVASFPEFKNIRQVSAGGGNEPQWRRDGKELFYMTGDGRLMAVGVSVTGSTLETTAPRELFATGVSTGTPGTNHYAVSADGNRFLVVGSVDSRPMPISVVLNWTSLLK